MRRFGLIAFMISVCLLSCKESVQQKNDSNIDGALVQNPATLSEDSTGKKLPVMELTETDHDFGKVKEGDKVEHDFIFTNTGEAPLLISNVKASCGCTTPYWPKNLIKPGASDKIKVVYDSKGRQGEFSKTIAVTANTYPNTTTLKISGVVFKD